LSTKALTIIGAVVIAAGIAIITITSGGGHEDSASAAETDGAFIVGMVPHHESAIEMAQIALKKAEHPEVKNLAKDIVSAQAAEVSELSALHRQLFGGPISAGEHGDLGLMDHQMGMDQDVSALANEKPFDRAFIDAMIPHHQGAIRMARVELESGDDKAVQSLADEIISAQAAEINQMNQWREGWYGSASPAGGVPSEEEEMSDMSMMEH